MIWKAYILPHFIYNAPIYLFISHQRGRIIKSIKSIYKALKNVSKNSNNGSQYNNY